MANFFTQVRWELYERLPSTSHVLLVFVSLMVVFGLLSSNQPTVWQAFLPVLLMGLSYGVVSLSLGPLFQEDWEDGTLEWRVSKENSLEVYVLVKILSHWVSLGVPLTGLTGILTGFSSFSLLLGIAMTTLALTALGAIGSALCLGAKANQAVLLPLLTLPLGVPMMLVSMAPVISSLVRPDSYLLLQIGILFMACALCLLACPFALRIALR